MFPVWVGLTLRISFKSSTKLSATEAIQNFRNFTLKAFSFSFSCSEAAPLGGTKLGSAADGGGGESYFGWGRLLRLVGNALAACPMIGATVAMATSASESDDEELDDDSSTTSSGVGFANIFLDFAGAFERPDEDESSDSEEDSEDEKLRLFRFLFLFRGGAR